jgi:hypothetical protein
MPRLYALESKNALGVDSELTRLEDSGLRVVAQLRGVNRTFAYDERVVHFIQFVQNRSGTMKDGFSQSIWVLAGFY